MLFYGYTIDTTIISNHSTNTAAMHISSAVSASAHDDSAACRHERAINIAAEGVVDRPLGCNHLRAHRPNNLDIDGRAPDGEVVKDRSRVHRSFGQHPLSDVGGIGLTQAARPAALYLATVHGTPKPT